MRKYNSHGGEVFKVLEFIHDKTQFNYVMLDGEHI